MSCYKCKKLIISEDERIDILNKYGILNEAVQYINPSNMLVKSRSFFANGKWKNLSPEGDAEFKKDLESTKEFLQKWQGKGYIVRVGIEASESQVTNYDREVEPKVFLNKGVLSQRRADTMKKLLTNIFNQYIEQGLIKQTPVFDPPEVIIGKTPYRRGVDSPTDPKYTPERYVSYMLRANAPLETLKPIGSNKEPNTPEFKPMPRVEIPGGKVPPFTGTGLTEECLVNLGIQFVYYSTPKDGFEKNTKRQLEDKTYERKGCCGGHSCNKADYLVKLNGVTIGEANLNNGPGKNYAKSVKSNVLSVSPELAKEIISKGSSVILSIVCKGTECHSDAPGFIITNLRNGKVLSKGCAPITVISKTPSAFIPGEVKLLYIEDCGRVIRKLENNIVKAGF
jgi:hypothetical protein